MIKIHLAFFIVATLTTNSPFRRDLFRDLDFGPKNCCHDTRYHILSMHESADWFLRERLTATSMSLTLITTSLRQDSFILEGKMLLDPSVNNQDHLNLYLLLHNQKIS